MIADCVTSMAIKFINRTTKSVDVPDAYRPRSTPRDPFERFRCSRTLAARAQNANRLGETRSDRDRDCETRWPSRSGLRRIFTTARIHRDVAKRSVQGYFDQIGSAPRTRVRKFINLIYSPNNVPLSLPPLPPRRCPSDIRSLPNLHLASRPAANARAYTEPIGGNSLGGATYPTSKSTTRRRSTTRSVANRDLHTTPPDALRAPFGRNGSARNAQNDARPTRPALPELFRFERSRESTRRRRTTALRRRGIAIRTTLPTRRSLLPPSRGDVRAETMADRSADCTRHQFRVERATLLEARAKNFAAPGDNFIPIRRAAAGRLRSPEPSVASDRSRGSAMPLLAASTDAL